ncbi:hypothetical protein L208DRAFT_1117250, partial [Tricholoma matsutake]
TNALESIIGIFLHSCGTPEKVIEALAHLGITISVNAIHHAITSLSTKSAVAIQQLGQTLLASYAYNNFDVDLKTSTPTAEKSTDTLKHLTSALLFPLQHGVTPDDMKCSDELWKKSQLNPKANPSDLQEDKTWKNFLTLHSKVVHPMGLTCHDRFNAWKFLYDLCHYGPKYFSQFHMVLGKPEEIEWIPIIKTKIIPACAMEFSNSTISGNISTIQNLARQGSVGDPNDPDEHFDVTDLSEHVLLFHGDLGTGDQI